MFLLIQYISLCSQLLNKLKHSLKDCVAAYSDMTVCYVSTTQSSNLVVSIVEHVYRVIALLLYITSRDSPRWPRLGLFLEVIY